MRVTSRRVTTMTEHESDGFERALKLAEERKFDELLEHLRVDDPRYGCLVDTCVRDERLLPVCARAGVQALDVIELLVEHGAEKRPLFQTAAFNGHVNLLDVACARGWLPTCQSPQWTYIDLMTSVADSAAGAALDEERLTIVLEWLDTSRTYFHVDCGDMDVKECTVTAIIQVLCGQCIGAADFLINRFVDFDLWDMNLLQRGVEEVIESGAMESLDYLCSIARVRKDLGGKEEYILEQVQHILEEGAPDALYDWHGVDDWLRERRKEGARIYLRSAMSTLDTVKENLPEGAYLQIVTSLQKLYETM